MAAERVRQAAAGTPPGVAEAVGVDPSPVFVAEASELAAELATSRTPGV
jgi:hypothetical protein